MLIFFFTGEWLTSLFALFSKKYFRQDQCKKALRFEAILFFGTKLPFIAYDEC